MRENTWRNYEDGEEWCERCGCPLDPDGNCPFGPDCELDEDDLGDHDPKDVVGLDSELWQDRE